MSAASVSVVMAVWNGAAYLAECLDNILAQSRPADEVIVVDDGSDDGTPRILDAYRPAVTVLSGPRGGQAAALVRGLGVASGSLLAFQDADDLWPADKLAFQIAELERDDALEAVFGMSRQFVSPEHRDNARLAPREELLKGELTQCMLIRRSAFARIGGFDPSLKGAHFVDWLARAKRAGLIYSVPDKVVHLRRLHPENQGRVATKDRDHNLLNALHRNIRRRRGEPAA